MTINRQWLLAERPSGMVGPHNFEYAETPIPEPKNNEVLVKNLFLSFDPAQRNWMVDRHDNAPDILFMFAYPICGGRRFLFKRFAGRPLQCKKSGQCHGR